MSVTFSCNPLQPPSSPLPRHHPLSLLPQLIIGALLYSHSKRVSCEDTRGRIISSAAEDNIRCLIESRKSNHQLSPRRYSPPALRLLCRCYYPPPCRQTHKHAHTDKYRRWASDSRRLGRVQSTLNCQSSVALTAHFSRRETRRGEGKMKGMEKVTEERSEG